MSTSQSFPRTPRIPGSMARAPRVVSKIWRRDSGQSLIEVALITPLILVMVLGVIDMGRYAYIGILVGNAARAGAAYGSAAPGDGVGIVAAACNDFLGTTASPSNLSPTATCDVSAGGANHLQVTSSVSCGCDNGGTISSLYGGACDDVPNKLSTDPIPMCVNGGGHWAAVVNVQASGTFNTLFNWPGIPSSITITRNADVRLPR